MVFFHYIILRICTGYDAECGEIIISGREVMDRFRACWMWNGGYRGENAAREKYRQIKLRLEGKE